MTDIEKTYFFLLRIGLQMQRSAEMPVVVSDKQWQKIYDLSFQQGTGALIWDALRLLHAEENLSLSLRVQWAYHVEQIERCYRKQEKVLTEIADFYISHSIPLMLLKGYGLSLYYPRPEHRPCGDIDIWLFGRQQMIRLIFVEQLYRAMTAPKANDILMPTEPVYGFSF